MAVIGVVFLLLLVDRLPFDLSLANFRCEVTLRYKADFLVMNAIYLVKLISCGTGGG